MNVEFVSFAQTLVHITPLPQICYINFLIAQIDTFATAYMFMLIEHLNLMFIQHLYNESGLTSLVHLHFNNFLVFLFFVEIFFHCIVNTP